MKYFHCYVGRYKNKQPENCVSYIRTNILYYKIEAKNLEALLDKIMSKPDLESVDGIGFLRLQDSYLKNIEPVTLDEIIGLNQRCREIIKQRQQKGQLLSLHMDNKAYAPSRLPKNMRDDFRPSGEE